MQEGKSPTPERIWQMITGFQMTAAMKAAIELGVFTKIADGKTSTSSIARACGAAERGIRILCDTLTVLGFLIKNGSEYSLADDAAFFLVQYSPAYMGNMTDFILSPQQKAGFDDLTAAVRNGGAVPQYNASLDPESPMWATFARSMTGMMMPSAQKMAADLGYPKDAAIKVLDIAAGHGMFGITVAQHYPNAQIHALDWKVVLAVAQENAEKFGVADRYHKIEGSAFDADLGSDYDVILNTNFLHHFDPPTCEAFLKRAFAALSPDGQLLTLEFVPNDDRVSPPGEALFSLVMLAATPAGDAYTFAELQQMLENAGFSQNEHRPMQGMPQHWIMSRK
ncbi:MAG TPA: class I SAM-dependent methyltransferase [Pyrinomonadaceae bacterium]|nr:class I SAM-dependent methyltransferase [Pyrinomonadaceae bacterium]